MSDCQQIAPLLTPYVDGVLGTDDATLVDAHVNRCPPCASRVGAERTVRTLLRDRREALCGESASVALHARCASLGSRRTVPRRVAWRQRVAPFALAASLVLVVAGAFVYQATGRSSRLLAAELTADHVKCFMIGPSGEGEAGTERVLASHFNWHARLPGDAERIGLRLVGARLCVYGQGRIAHLMYRHNGHPVSVFMLPDTSRGSELVDVFGHEAAIWNVGNRTFVLIASEPRDEVAQMASVVHAGLR